jgi:lysophospholipase L1-like esterase
MLLLLASAHGAELIVFGDSWAEGAADELEEALHDAGFSSIDVDPRGVGGSTAEHWADTDPSALSDAIADNPDARWIWLSIGGNDLFAHHYAGIGDQTAADNDTHIRLIIDGALAARPDIKVVMFGYDFVNFEQSTDCILLAWTYFGTSITTWQLNSWFMGEQIGDVQAGIAADYPGVTYVEGIWGTLQEAGGVHGAPNLYLPSPSAYMSDCIHPTSAGYRLIMDALVQEWWGRPEPTADIDGDTQLCAGQPSDFTAVTDAERLSWLLDGAEVGTDPMVSVTLSAGEHTLTLVAHSGPWEDRDALTLTALDCDTGTADTAVDTAGDSGVDAGDTGPADSGSPEGAPPGRCGCGGGSAAVGGLWLLAWTRRRRGQGAALRTPPASSPPAPARRRGPAGSR